MILNDLCFKTKDFLKAKEVCLFVLKRSADINHEKARGICAVLCKHAWAVRCCLPCLIKQMHTHTVYMMVSAIARHEKKQNWKKGFASDLLAD